ncbi:MAG: YihA family ribosome biogenesis GTP-binding protein [Clostridia bacterium]|nr:YihA family ribosome biogenesis GTP-binding protein [Clostridia bacterium]
MDFRITKAEFKTSVGTGGAYPEKTAAELAIVGKSNVGKSSLINSLCNMNKLAKTSQKPGKTRLINFFLVNGEFSLVDLPGYGFAQASKQEQAAWGALIENYLASGRVDHIIMLLDIRHEPTADDLQMFKYILYYAIPYTLVATKADKLAVSKRRQAANRCAKLLGAPPYAIAFSGETGDGKEELLARLDQVVHPVGEPAEEDEAAPNSAGAAEAEPGE